MHIDGVDKSVIRVWEAWREAARIGSETIAQARGTGAVKRYEDALGRYWDMRYALEAKRGHEWVYRQFSILEKGIEPTDLELDLRRVVRLGKTTSRLGVDLSWREIAPTFYEYKELYQRLEIALGRERLEAEIKRLEAE